MIEVSQLTALIVGETLVGLLVLSGVLVLLVILRKGRIRKAAHHLAERVQSDKEKRTERLKALLAEKYGYEGSELDQALHNITQTEMRLYQNIINGFLKDDQIFLQQVDVDVENLVLSYQGLNTPQGSSSEVVEVSDDSDAAEEIKHLREENERLSDELKVTMDTMGRMLNEYSTMFAGGSAETFEKVAEEAVPEPVAETSSEPMPESPAEETSPEVEPEPTVEAPSPEPIAEPSTSEQQEPEPEIMEVSETEMAAAAQELPADEEINVDSTVDIDIPDFQPSDDLMQGSDLYEPSADDLDGAASAVDDDVSEIIDEVMEIADEISANDESGSSADATGGVTESLMDEVAQVDIEIPDMESVAPTPEESEAASLEEEWAKLLEEDAASEDEKKDQ
jgi:hypothetical protein